MIYKLIFIVSIILFAVVLILPTFGEKRMRINFMKDSTPEQIQAVKHRFPSASYTLADEQDYSFTVVGSNLTDAIMNEVRTFPGVKDVSFAKHWAEDLVMARKINLGLDLQGGMQVTLRADFDKIAKLSGKSLTDSEKTELTQQALELLRNRIDKFGVAEPSIRPAGNQAIEIQLPGVKNPGMVRELIGKVGKVDYRIVDDVFSKRASDWVQVHYSQDKLPNDEIELADLGDKIAQGIELPETLEVLFYFDRPEGTTKLVPTYPLVLNREISLAGADIKKAWVDTDEMEGLVVHFVTTPEGAVKFADVTSKKNRDKRMAIVIDRKIRSAPAIKNQITGGSAQITGNFSQEEVRSLARIINEGALPVDLQFIEERTVGPSLGQDSIESGMRGLLVASAIVMLFMLGYYKLAGIIANIGLVLNIMFQMAILSWLGFTLTLPGIAGLILTIGMAVDANVIIYERVKEELRDGKSVRMSIVHGFERAFWTIFDSNLTTMIAAFILLQYGTGPIKGFAVTLFIGLISSMFVALYITRYVYDLISLNKKLKKLSI
ncbi:MAG: protein translocase subunit SecD [Spirochaetes bacterium]|nr:protein translocase subunit SecD [Spirochaetota bacterium]